MHPPCITSYAPPLALSHFFDKSIDFSKMCVILRVFKSRRVPPHREYVDPRAAGDLKNVNAANYVRAASQWLRIATIQVNSKEFKDA